MIVGVFRHLAMTKREPLMIRKAPYTESIESKRHVLMGAAWSSRTSPYSGCFSRQAIWSIKRDEKICCKWLTWFGVRNGYAMLSSTVSRTHAWPLPYDD